MNNNNWKKWILIHVYNNEATPYESYDELVEDMYLDCLDAYLVIDPNGIRNVVKSGAPYLELLRDL